jgi:hypothetical protein
MNTAVVSRETLKAKIQLAVTKVPTGTCFISGVRHAGY